MQPMTQSGGSIVTSMKTKVLIVDSNPIVRDGLRLAFEQTDDFEVIAEAMDGYATLMAARNTRPDVIVLDDYLGDMDAYDCVVLLRKTNPSLHILVRYASLTPVEIQRLLNAGMMGFVGRNASAQEFVQASRALLQGGSYFSASIAMRLFTGDTMRGGINMMGLTNREIEVLRLLATGLSNKDIARRLNLSVRTVETHRFNIRHKAKVRRLRDLIQLAKRLELMPPGAEESAAEAPAFENSQHPPL